MPTERKDLETHILQGTKPEYMSEPVFKSGRPKMPKDLPPLAIEEWRRITCQLCKRKTLTKGDATILELHCRIYSRYRKVEALAAEHPVTETSWLDKNGNEHIKQDESPASKIASRLESQMRAYLVQLSATPASRKLTKPDKTAKDPDTAAEKAMLSRSATQPAPADDDALLDVALKAAETIQ